MNNNNVVVIYHNNCADGVMSAAIVLQYYLAKQHKQMLEDCSADCFEVSILNNSHMYRHLIHKGNTDVAHHTFMLADNTTITFVPADYHKKYDAETLAASNINVEGANIYIVDFSTDVSDLNTLCAKAHHCTVIDHHASAIKKYDDCVSPSNCTLIMSTELSGCELTYKHLFNNDYPVCVKLVGERDRWCISEEHKKFHLAYTSGMRNLTVPYSEAYDKLFCRSRQDFAFKGLNADSLTPFLLQELVDDVNKGSAVVRELLEVGGVLLGQQQQHISMCFKNVVYTNLNMHGNVPFFNLPKWLVSDSLNQFIVEHGHKFAVAYQDEGDTRLWSLRSIGDFDVSEIAEIFGGGGHKNAAGFTSPITVSPYDLNSFANLVTMFESAKRVGQDSVNYVYTEVAQNGLRPNTLKFLRTKYKYTGE